eukprot:CAMPEP_0174370060 /NCGR_PEP_ID=MMETSP0811_2-20130205/94824_1 /TAXON_ID=73025 ORGANISM="Eutreptiella gymnastica-like, Strain CCMP1594" /NCGR_SAMPLE_ID=MMETSP0811_2 /ASSEMBLY_ACC=CAM_ASM_000667 /LENGTH=162 /DNA_ID=CAMNT_0015515127 /DNA_START=220 /DNA_END=709 /DNA_ORIENTATION=+
MARIRVPAYLHAGLLSVVHPEIHYHNGYEACPSNIRDTCSSERSQTCNDPHTRISHRLGYTDVVVLPKHVAAAFGPPFHCGTAELEGVVFLREDVRDRMFSAGRHQEMQEVAVLHGRAAACQPVLACPGLVQVRLCNEFPLDLLALAGILQSHIAQDMILAL